MARNVSLFWLPVVKCYGASLGQILNREAVYGQKGTVEPMMINLQIHYRPT